MAWRRVVAARRRSLTVRLPHSVGPVSPTRQEFKVKVKTLQRRAYALWSKSREEVIKKSRQKRYCEKTVARAANLRMLIF